MFDETAIQRAAGQLLEAEQTRRPIPQISHANPSMTIEDAYAIQRALIALKLAQGRVQVGRKIGLTSRAMQQAVGIAEPDYGVLLDDMLLEDAAQLSIDRLIAPRVEVELAFILRKTLSGPGVTIFDVLNATDFVVPALEILDARVQRVDPATQRTRTVFDTIADNAANCAVVLGGRPIRPDDIDLRWIAALCYRNGAIEETGVSAGVLSHPANGIAWLANCLARHEESVEAGQVILAGSFIRPIDARRGDTFHADYGPFGAVTCHFA